MNSQLNGDVFRELLRLLEALRVCTDRDARAIRLGRCWGFNSALCCAGLISLDEQFRLDALAQSAFDYSGQVFPGGIVGPVMPIRVWLERNRVSNTEINDAAVKLWRGCLLMSVPAKYLRLPHAPNCDCSVCWSRIATAQPALSRSTPCDQCRPASVRLVDGRWQVTPRSFCAKHEPNARPPKYWSVVLDTGRPTPCVPIHDPFELVG